MAPFQTTVTDATLQESIEAAIRAKLKDDQQMERDAWITDVLEQTVTYLRSDQTKRLRRAINAGKDISPEDLLFVQSLNRVVAKIADNTPLDNNDRAYLVSIGLEYWGTREAKSMHLKLMRIAADNMDRPDVEKFILNEIHSVVNAFGYNWTEAAQFGDWYLSQSVERQNDIPMTMLQIADTMRQQRDIHMWEPVEQENPFVRKAFDKYRKRLESPEFALLVKTNEYRYWKSEKDREEKVLADIALKPENKKKAAYLQKLDKEIARLEKSTNAAAMLKLIELEKEQQLVSKSLESDSRVGQAKYQIRQANEQMARIFPHGPPKE